MRFAKAAVVLAALSALALAGCDQAATTAEAPEAAATTEAVAPAVEAYVGKWAVSAAECGMQQEQQGAPYIFTSDGFDQHEAHCTWANVQDISATAWRIAAACQVEGDEQSLSFDISVDGDVMQMNPGGQLVRCPS